jgi:hypothetical protein
VLLPIHQPPPPPPVSSSRINYVALPEIVDAMYRDERMDLVTHENALGDTMEQNELRRFQVQAPKWPLGDGSASTRALPPQ